MIAEEKIQMNKRISRTLDEYYELSPNVNVCLRENCSGSKSVFIDITEIMRDILGNIVVKAEYELHFHGNTGKELLDEVQRQVEAIFSTLNNNRRFEFECDVIIKFINGRELKMTSAEWGFIYC